MDSPEIIRETPKIRNERFSDTVLDHANSGNRKHREVVQKRSIFDSNLKPSRQPFVRNPASQRAMLLHARQYDGRRQHTWRWPLGVLRAEAAKAESRGSPSLSARNKLVSPLACSAGRRCPIGPDQDTYASVVDGDKLIAVPECGGVA